MVPCALALCLIARGDPARAIIGAANLGRDSDTIAGMAGGLSGALAGARALPVEWVDKVVRANPEPDLVQLVTNLCQVLIEQAEERQRSAQAILSLT
jgi:ADP-ribosylglycohydrolase